jgi:hypothetical protein
MSTHRVSVSLGDFCFVFARGDFNRLKNTRVTPAKRKMTTALKLIPNERPVKCPLTPELKDFIDRVIVPILVKEYLAAEKGVAEGKPSVASFRPMTQATDPEVPR